MPGKVAFLYRVDIGFDPSRCYACTVTDVQMGRLKGLKGGSMEQLLSRIRRVILDEQGKKKHFPLEKEEPVIITPDKF